MSVASWQHFFKPEVRSSGLAFIKKGVVSVSQLSDTEIQSYVRASTSCKVTIKSPSVSSATINVDCSCPVSKKGHFCKHIWAALLVIEEKKPDFLDSKTQLEKISAEEMTPNNPIKTSIKVKSQAQLDSAAAFKAKQAEYRKAQYQKQKLNIKDKKLKAKKIDKQRDNLFPTDVEEALKYFAINGFSLRDNLTKENVSFAMKKLSKVFHPDVGGSHEEILELNRFSELLIKYSK